jgi:hypothetical protein
MIVANAALFVGILLVKSQDRRMTSHAHVMASMILPLMMPLAAYARVFVISLAYKLVELNLYSLNPIPAIFLPRLFLLLPDCSFV